jgi:hypothetical protein
MPSHTGCFCAVPHANSQEVKHENATPVGCANSVGALISNFQGIDSPNVPLWPALNPALSAAITPAAWSRRWGRLHRPAGVRGLTRAREYQKWGTRASSLVARLERARLVSASVVDSEVVRGLVVCLSRRSQAVGAGRE